MCLNRRLLADRVLKRHILGERIGIGRDLRQDRQQRLDLRGEIETPSHDCIVKRLDAEAVARGKQAFAVPERERKHAAQVRQAIRAPLGVGGQDCLGVRRRAEFPTVFNSSINSM